MPLSLPSPDWDQLYREGCTPWDKGAPSPPLLEWLEANPGIIRGRVLVPGSGFGHDVRILAAQPEVAEVVGLDLSPAAVAAAVAFAGDRPRAGIERHFTGDLFDLAPAHRGAYDWVWEHTCFCAIDPERRDDYAKAVWSALRPGGSFLGVFYLDPYDDGHAPGGGPPHGCTLEELEVRFAGGGRFSILESYVPSRAYEGREGLERMVRMTRLGS